MSDRQYTAWSMSLIPLSSVPLPAENDTMVLLPAFETSGMIRTGKRKIKSKTVSKTVRGMLTYAWSHGHIIASARGCYIKCTYQGRTRIVCDEAYTSKTRGQCGGIHQHPGVCKTFKCPSCKLVIERDVNRARNILLRYLTLHRSVYCTYD
jgi:hypothetical protein